MIHYFAYGSCMDIDSFLKTVGEGNCEIAGAATLKNYRLAFNLFSEYRQGGVADIVASPGDYVEGVLYRLKPEALPALDEREGVGTGRYRRMDITVEYNGTEIRTMTYTVVHKEKEELSPGNDYAQLIYNGAVRHLSGTYRKKLVNEWEQKFGLDHFKKLEERRK
ncbi:gamma-glutamylcyclotransferase family protein [Paenactinomyces guangxiensis]|uniref:Gamma-glutamylcyclotransferase n=1 Tax=Paenactinomyces guangxiensis TaxID=1490290 RepID=A0A7W2A628_9BACL|nr:gamma-glutamylcyclotransferase family protein [Paenactinomyces guangxiensis]MBA4492946.1 gamma-glutamylcyclotransferase [Paenactinomyces guangxiensis]MBH8590205.1 gamma-glutamylcyclotransferase [Paenactinomyces guangxiensis]